MPTLEQDLTTLEQLRDSCETRIEALADDAPAALASGMAAFVEFYARYETLYDRLHPGYTPIVSCGDDVEYSAARGFNPSHDIVDRVHSSDDVSDDVKRAYQRACGLAVKYNAAPKPRIQCQH
jgi:hypothetical protein